MKLYSIAMVDDDPDDLELIEQSFLSIAEDAHVETFSSGKDFLAFIHSASELPLLVLLDYNMPILNGEDILIQINQEEKLSSIKVVFLSSGMTVSLREKLMDLGAYCCISKPSSTDAYKRLANSLAQIAYELLQGRAPSISNL
jgi:CheY-like chemotaxis protein